MITKSLSFRLSFLFFIISTTLLFISSCKIGEDDNTTTIAGEDGYIPIGSQVIGPSGGEINLDSIIVKVPSGAFNENNELNIYVGEENDGFNEYGISSLYQIGGLPSTINKPIRLSIKYHGTIEGDTLVAIGEMGYATSLDSSLYSYHTESASDSAGYLIYDLPANSELGKLAQPKDIIDNTINNFIALGGNKRVPSSEGHFMLTYPLWFNEQGILIGDHFETAFTKCKTMGFSYPVRQWPANVLTKTLKTGLGGYYSYKNSEPNGKNTVTDAELISFINHGQFTINSNLLTDDLELRTTCGHEFLHLVQNLYEFSSPNIEIEQNWLSEATSVWIEGKYANNENYVSSSITNREFYPFVGWQYTASNRSHARQGYGLSVIIKEIADKYGDSTIVKIFEKIKSGTLPNNAVDPVDAVLSVIDEPVSTFWHRVLGDYVLGHYYNNLVNFKFLDKPDSYSGKFEIYAGFSKKSILTEYHDLSGNLFKVSSGDLSSLDKVPLSFTVDDPINYGILVAKYKQGSEITKIGEIFPGGSGIVTLGNAKPVFDAGYALVVMVSNSTHDKTKNYQGKNNTWLTVEIKEPEKQIDRVEFGVSLDIANTKLTLASGAESYGTGFGCDLNSIWGTSSLSDNIYTTIFANAINSETTYNGYLNVTFLDDPRRVNIDAEWSETRTDCINNFKIDYDGIPFEQSFNNFTWDEYSERGSSVSRINVSNERICSWGTRELLNTNSADDAMISLNVYYYE